MRPTVKTRSRGAPADPKRAGGWARHLEGWQPGLVALLLAGSATWLSVPRPVPATELPLPRVAPSALAASADRDAELARQAQSTRLHVDTRTVGSAVRAYGRADHDADEHAVVDAKRKAEQAARLPGATTEALLALRAYQLESFLREVARWEATGEESDELVELGGSFVATLRQRGWCDPAACRVALLPDAARRASFKRRWNEILGTRAPELEPTAAERTALLVFLLEHPGATDATADRSTPALREAAARAEDGFRLGKLDEAQALDPAFPADLARGILLARLGRNVSAVEAFRRHLGAHPDGPWALRAQNHLRAALDHVSEADEAP